jgi:hypothetical protein
MDARKAPADPPKSSKQGLRRAHTVGQTASQSQRGSPHRPGRLRTNSLRRQNNSDELMDQRSADPSSGSAPDRTDGREGRYFTVGNVGHNGKIYLRYGFLF